MGFQAGFLREIGSLKMGFGRGAVNGVGLIGYFGDEPSLFYLRQPEIVYSVSGCFLCDWAA